MLLQTTFRAVFYTLLLTACIKQGLRFINRARELNEYLQTETVCKLGPAVIASVENGTAYVPVQYLTINLTYTQGMLKYPHRGTKGYADLRKWLTELPPVFSCRLHGNYLHVDVSEIQAIIIISVVIVYCVLCCGLCGLVIAYWCDWLRRVCLHVKRD